MSNNDLKEKISALLAKAERTDNEHERDAFTAKAEQLMLKYGIEQAELEAAGKVKAEKIIQITVPFTGDYSIVMPQFTNAVCLALGNLQVLQSKMHHKKGVVVYIIGHESDVRAAEALLNSLYLQGMTAMKKWARWASKNDERYIMLKYVNSMEQYKARRQFLMSFGLGAADRIKSERRVVEAEASPGAGLVLASRQEAVDNWVASNHILRKGRGGAQGGAMGAAQGHAAGRNANVGTPGLGGGRRAIQ